MRADRTVDTNTRRMLRLDDPVIWGNTPGVNGGAFANAVDRANFTTLAFNNRTATSPDWAEATAAQQQTFINGTGLNAQSAPQVWNDINRWKRSPTPNFNGEARAAFNSTVILADPVMREYLLGIARSIGTDTEFDRMSVYLMRKSYEGILQAVNTTNEHPQTLNDGSLNPRWLPRQREIEIELAARTARLHNGDLSGASARTATLAQMLAADREPRGREYATRFLNAFEWPVVVPSNPMLRQPTADYFSLRCTETLPPTISRGGLQLSNLIL